MSEEIQLKREVEVTAIPAGTKKRLAVLALVASSVAAAANTVMLTVHPQWV